MTVEQINEVAIAFNIQSPTDDIEIKSIAFDFVSTINESVYMTATSIDI